MIPPGSPATTPAGLSPRGRAWLTLWLVGLPLVSWLVGDLFPLSRMPMFSAAPRERWQLRVLRPDGSAVDPWRLDLTVLDPASPEARFGAVPASLLLGPGPFPEAVLTERVQRRFASGAAGLPHVEVVQERIGARGLGLAVLERRRLRVSAP